MIRNALHSPRSLAGLFTCLLLLSIIAVRAAETDPSVAQIESVKSAIAASTNLSDKVAAQLNGDLDGARSQLTALQARQADVEADQQEAATYSDNSEKLQREIRTLLDTPRNKIDTAASVS